MQKKKSSVAFNVVILNLEAATVNSCPFTPTKQSLPNTNKIAPKNTIIKIDVATIDSLKIDKKPGNSRSSIFLSLLPENLGANLSTNQTPNICWWPIANPPPSVNSCVASTVKFAATAQYTPNTIPNKITNCNWFTLSPKAKAINQVAVADCCTMM